MNRPEELMFSIPGQIYGPVVATVEMGRDYANGHARHVWRLTKKGSDLSSSRWLAGWGARGDTRVALARQQLLLQQEELPTAVQAAGATPVPTSPPKMGT